MFYADNAFTPVGPRQTQHYRVHTMYRPKPWATISGAYNDLERHNNTNNNQSAVAAGDDPYEGPLDHMDHSRSGKHGRCAPSERALWVRFQLRLQRCIYGHQYLL